MGTPQPGEEMRVETYVAIERTRAMVTRQQIRSCFHEIDRRKPARRHPSRSSGLPFESNSLRGPNRGIDAWLATAIDLMETAADLLARHHRARAFDGRHYVRPASLRPVAACPSRDRGKAACIVNYGRAADDAIRPFAMAPQMFGNQIWRGQGVTVEEQRDGAAGRRAPHWRRQIARRAWRYGGRQFTPSALAMTSLV